MHNYKSNNGTKIILFRDTEVMPEEPNTEKLLSSEGQDWSRQGTVSFYYKPFNIICIFKTIDNILLLFSLNG